MADYYQVDDSGSIFLIRESRIISETPKTITIKSEGGSYTHRYKRESLLTNFTEAKVKADSIIKEKIKSLQTKIENQQDNLEKLENLNDKQLRNSKCECFLTKEW